MMKNPKNMRQTPELPLIVETDASKKAVGASLIQEIPNEDGTKEKVLIYAASRSFKSAETRYSTIRRELLAVVFAVQKFRRFLIGRDFLIRTDHRPLVGLFKKPLLCIENEDLRDLVSQRSEYSFTVENVPGPGNAFPDWLSRNCLDEVYSYQDHRRTEDGFIEVLQRRMWKRSVSAQDRQSLLFSWHTRFHRGYAHMIKWAEDMNVTWPYITKDIREYLSDCGCALTKNNRLKCASWGKPEALLPDENSYALDLYTYAGKMYLSIPHFKSESFWSLEVPEKTAEVITDLLVV
jgi:hypothetical protein